MRRGGKYRASVSVTHHHKVSESEDAPMEASVDAAERAKVWLFVDRRRRQSIAGRVDRNRAGGQSPHHQMLFLADDLAPGHSQEAGRLVRSWRVVGVEEADVEEPAPGELVEDLRARDETA